MECDLFWIGSTLCSEKYGFHGPQPWMKGCIRRHGVSDGTVPNLEQ